MSAWQAAWGMQPKIYLTSPSQGDKRLDWQRALSHFWSCVLTSDSSSCLLSLNTSALPIQTKVTEQSAAPLSCCTTPQAKGEHTHTHTHMQEGPHWHVLYMHVWTHTQKNWLFHQTDYQDKERAEISWKKQQLIKVVGTSHWGYAWQMSGLCACPNSRVLALHCPEGCCSQRHTKIFAKNVSKSGAKATGFPALIAYACTEAHAQIIITKIPIN